MACTNSLAGLRRRYLCWNNAWNIDAQLRYQPLVELLRTRGVSSLAEVGCGNTGISGLFAQDVIGFDLAFEKGIVHVYSPRLHPVIASGSALPVRDRSFEAVVCVDALEHIPPPLRGRALRELLRCTQCWLVFCVPMGAAAERSDRELLEFYVAHHGTQPFWLTEHLEYGIPTSVEVLRLIDDAVAALGRTVHVESFEHMNIDTHNVVHRVLMFGHYRFARLLSLPLAVWVWARRHIRPRAYYRRFYIIEILK